MTMMTTAAPFADGNFWERDHEEVAPPEAEGDPGYTPEQADEAFEFLPPSKIEFHVTDEASAAWALGKIVDCDRRSAGIDAMAAKMKADVEKERSFFVGRFGAELEWFAGERLAEINKGRPMADWKKKSVKLLTGVLGFKKRARKLEIVDETALRDWALDNCPTAVKAEIVAVIPTDVSPSQMEALQNALAGIGVDIGDVTRESILKTPLNEWFESTGEIPNGVSVREAKQEFIMEGV